jgi:hypothetical protein
VAKRRYRVCEYGHAVHDDAAVFCPQCGTPLAREILGLPSRQVRDKTDRSGWAPGIGGVALLLCLLVIAYLTSPQLRDELVALGSPPESPAAGAPVALTARPAGVLATPTPVTAVQIGNRTPSPAPTPTLACDLRLAYIADVTYPDGSVVKAGTVVAKTWRVRNSGACAWPVGVRLQPIIGGVPMIGPGAAVSALAAGQEGEITLRVRLPQVAGSAQSQWTLCYGDTCAPSTLTMVVVVQE